MAFPTVVGTGLTSAGSTASATPQLLLPGIVSPGSLLVAYIRVATTGDIGWPGGWTEFFDEAVDASDDQYSAAWATAVGDEDGTSIGLTSANAKYAAISYAIDGWDTPQCGTRDIGASTTPDPPSFSPTGGAKDYLWLWFGSWEGEQTSPPAGTPTNYTNALGSSSGIGGAITTNCRVASARRQNNTATEDAPSWTISVSDQWSANVIAIPPQPVVPNPIFTPPSRRAASRFLTLR